MWDTAELVNLVCSWVYQGFIIISRREYRKIVQDMEFLWGFTLCYIHDMRFLSIGHLNPFNAEATYVQTTRKQRFLKTV